MDPSPDCVLDHIMGTGRGYRLSPRGALTPALPFGDEFVLEIETTRRYDELPRAYRGGHQG